MKELIEKLKEITNGINNLSEKCEGFYEDALYTEEPKIEIFEKIAEDLSVKFSKYNFKEEDESYAHPFISCEDDLCKELGLKSINLCPYKGMMHSYFLDSNFMWSCFKEEDTDSLFIDVYDTFFMSEKDMKEYILQELYNFKRDCEWAINGTYDEEINKMKANNEIQGFI